LSLRRNTASLPASRSPSAAEVSAVLNSCAGTIVFDMTLPRSRQALNDAHRAVFELRQTSDRTEDFPRRYRGALALVMAVGPVLNSETRKAPKDWWKPHVEPDGRPLMKLRTALLKENDDSLDPNFQPASARESARRLRGNRKSFALMPGVPPPVIHLPNWKIKSGDYEGKDAIAVLEAYIAKLEKLMALAEPFE
jgi:hypothetical protein